MIFWNNVNNIDEKWNTNWNIATLPDTAFGAQHYWGGFPAKARARELILCGARDQEQSLTRFGEVD